MTQQHSALRQNDQNMLNQNQLSTALKYAPTGFDPMLQAMLQPSRSL